MIDAFPTSLILVLNDAKCLRRKIRVIHTANTEGCDSGDDPSVPHSPVVATRHRMYVRITPCSTISVLYYYGDKRGVRRRAYHINRGARQHTHAAHAPLSMAQTPMMGAILDYRGLHTVIESFTRCPLSSSFPLRHCQASPAATESK